MTPITPVHFSLPAIGHGAAQTTAPPGAFQSVLSNAITNVENFQNNARTSVNNFLNGEGEELHKVALAAQQADLSFQMFMQVRNKVVAAYNQVMQMQV